jgi:hypothetical protein
MDNHLSPPTAPRKKHWFEETEEERRQRRFEDWEDYSTEDEWEPKKRRLF